MKSGPELGTDEEALSVGKSNPDAIVERVVSRIQNAMLADFLPESPDAAFFEKRVEAAKAFVVFKNWCRENCELVCSVEATDSEEACMLKSELLAHLSERAELSEGQIAAVKNLLETFIYELVAANILRGEIDSLPFSIEDPIDGLHFLVKSGFMAHNEPMRSSRSYIYERGFAFEDNIRVWQYDHGQTLTIPSVVAIGMGEVDAQRLYVNCAASWKCMGPVARGEDVQGDSSSLLERRNGGFYPLGSASIAVLDHLWHSSLRINLHEESHYVFHKLFGKSRNTLLNREHKMPYSHAKMCASALLQLTMLKDELIARIAELPGRVESARERDTFATLVKKLIADMRSHYGKSGTKESIYSYFAKVGPEEFGDNLVVRFLIDNEKKIAETAIIAAEKLIHSHGFAYEILLFTPLELWGEMVEHLEQSGQLLVDDNWAAVSARKDEYSHHEIPSSVQDLDPIVNFSFTRAGLGPWRSDSNEAVGSNSNMGLSRNNLALSASDQAELLSLNMAKYGEWYVMDLVRSFVSAAIDGSGAERCIEATEVYAALIHHFADLVELGDRDPDAFENYFVETWEKIASHRLWDLRWGWHKSFDGSDLEKHWSVLLSSGTKLIRGQRVGHQERRIDELMPVWQPTKETFFMKITESALLSVVPSYHDDVIQAEVEPAYTYASVALALDRLDLPDTYVKPADIYGEVKERVLARFDYLDDMSFHSLFVSAWLRLLSVVDPLVEAAGEYSFCFINSMDTHPPDDSWLNDLVFDGDKIIAKEKTTAQNKTVVL